MAYAANIVRQRRYRDSAAHSKWIKTLPEKRRRRFEQRLPGLQQRSVRESHHRAGRRRWKEFNDRGGNVAKKKQERISSRYDDLQRQHGKTGDNCAPSSKSAWHHHQDNLTDVEVRRASSTLGWPHLSLKSGPLNPSDQLQQELSRLRKEGGILSVGLPQAPRTATYGRPKQSARKSDPRTDRIAEYWKLLRTEWLDHGGDVVIWCRGRDFLTDLKLAEAVANHPRVFFHQVNRREAAGSAAPGTYLYVSTTLPGCCLKGALSLLKGFEEVAGYHGSPASPEPPFVPEAFSGEGSGGAEGLDSYSDQEALGSDDEMEPASATPESPVSDSEGVNDSTSLPPSTSSVAQDKELGRRVKKGAVLTKKKPGPLSNKEKYAMPCDPPPGGWKCQRCDARVRQVPYNQGPHLREPGKCAFPDKVGEDSTDDKGDATGKRKEARNKTVPKQSVRLRDWFDMIKGRPGDEGLSEDAVESMRDLEGVVCVQDIRRGLNKLHLQLGHGSRGDMMRMLKLAHCRPKVMGICKQFTCAECERHGTPRAHRNVKIRRTRRFRDVVGFDLIEVQLADDSHGAGLDIVDHHTQF